METSKAKGKRSMKDTGMEEEDEDEDEDVGEDNKRSKALTLTGRKAATTAGSTQSSCQVEDCTAELKDAKPYHRRHKVCEHHSKAPIVLVAGLQQRFCQQCSRLRNL